MLTKNDKFYCDRDFLWSKYSFTVTTLPYSFLISSLKVTYIAFICIQVSCLPETLVLHGAIMFE